MVKSNVGVGIGAAGSGGRVFVAELPPVATANPNLFYVLTTDWTQWTPRGVEVVPATAATPASLVAKDFEHSDVRDPGNVFQVYRGVVNNADPINPVQGNYWYDRGAGFWQFAQSGGTAVTPSTLTTLFSSGLEISNGDDDVDLWVYGGYLNSQQAANYDDAASFLSWIDPPRQLNLRNLVDYFDDGWKFYYYDEALGVVRTVTGYNAATEGVAEHETPAWQSVGGGGGGGGSSVSTTPGSVVQVGDTLEDQVDDRYFQIANFPGSSIRDTDVLHFIGEEYASFDDLPGKLWNDAAVNDGEPAATEGGVGQFVLAGIRPDSTGTSDTSGIAATLHVRKYAGDTMWIASERGATFSNLKVYRKRELTVSVTAAPGGTTQLQGNTLQSRDTFPDAADFGLGDIINVLGHQFERGTTPHVGGPKDGSFLTLLDANFRGFHRQTNSISNFVTGNFYYSLNDNLFHRRESTGGVISVLPYDPFAEGEPWAPYTYRGHVDTDAAALAAATEIGEAWAVISAASHPASGHVHPGWGLVRVAVLGRVPGQSFAARESREPTSGWTAPMSELILTSRTHRTRIYPGSVYDLPMGRRTKCLTAGPTAASWLSLPSDIDTAGAPASGTDRVVFQLPPGLWDLDFYIAQNAASGQHAQIRLMKVQSGTDDIEVPASLGFNAAGGTLVQQNIGIAITSHIPDLSTDGTEFF